jgi:uncharacterized protein YegP (UPF0339 family)
MSMNAFFPGGSGMGLLGLGPIDKWEIYKDHREEWRWRRTAVNGRIVGASTQGYKSKEHCIENAIRNGYRPWPSQALK